jgi:hypothetical protein
MSVTRVVARVTATLAPMEAGSGVVAVGARVDRGPRLERLSDRRNLPWDDVTSAPAFSGEERE